MRKLIVLGIILAALLLPCLSAQADVSPLPSNLSLSYMRPVTGDSYICGVASWRLSDKPLWDRFTVDVIVPLNSGTTDALFQPTLGLGFNISAITPKLHVGATLLLPKSQGYAGFYISVDVLTF